MRHDSESTLETAIQAVHSDVPDAMQISASTKRVADRLGIDPTHSSIFSAIESCDDVQHLFGSYRAGTLPEASALLIRVHLRDCGECHRSYAAGPGKAGLDWSAPPMARARAWNLRAFRWAFAPTFAVLALTFVLYRAFWQVPPGVRAEVESIDGSASRISDAGDAPHRGRRQTERRRPFAHQCWRPRRAAALGRFSRRGQRTQCALGWRQGTQHDAGCR